MIEAKAQMKSATFDLDGEKEVIEEVSIIMDELDQHNNRWSVSVVQVKKDDWGDCHYWATDSTPEMTKEKAQEIYCSLVTSAKIHGFLTEGILNENNLYYC